MILSAPPMTVLNSLRRAPVAALMAGAALLLGCSTQRQPVFSLAGTSIVWPTPPDRARIRYIGELIGEASLGRRTSALAALQAVFEGPPPLAAFATPTAVAVSGLRVSVADPSHPSGPLIHVLDLNSQAYSQIREAGGAALLWPIDVAAAGDKLAIADAKRAAVFVINTQGQTIATIGAGALQRPAAVAWRAGGAELWVLDAAAHAVVVFDAAGRERGRFGGRGVAEGQFNFPAGLGCAKERAGAGAALVAIADSMNFRVQLLDPAGAARKAFGKKGDGAGDFSLPRDVAFDSAGHVYVLDNQFENVQIFDQDGRLLMALGHEGRGPGEFSLPAGITIDADDRIWVADTYNRRVQVFEYLRESANVRPTAKPE